MLIMLTAGCEELAMLVWYIIATFILYIIGIIVEGPQNVTYLPGQTPLPIELTCIATEGVVSWRVNGTDHTLSTISVGELPGHNVTGTNILVNSPVNNTEYVCVSSNGNSVTLSDPAYIITPGEYNYIYLYIIFINY